METTIWLALDASYEFVFGHAGSGHGLIEGVRVITSGCAPGPREEISFDSSFVLPHRRNSNSVFELYDDVVLYREYISDADFVHWVGDRNLCLREVSGPLAFYVILVNLQSAEELVLELDRHYGNSLTLSHANLHRFSMFVLLALLGNRITSIFIH